MVRQTVASQGYGLQVLINDENPAVRQTVALQGYGLDKLEIDPDPMVAEAARHMKQQ